MAKVVAVVENEGFKPIASSRKTAKSKTRAVHSAWLTQARANAIKQLMDNGTLLECQPIC